MHDLGILGAFEVMNVRNSVLSQGISWTGWTQAHRKSYLRYSPTQTFKMRHATKSQSVLSQCTYVEDHFGMLYIFHGREFACLSLTRRMGQTRLALY